MKVRYFEKRGQWWMDFKDASGSRKRVPTGCSSESEAKKAAPAILARHLSAPQAAPSAGSEVAGLHAPFSGHTVPHAGQLKVATFREAFDRGLREREKWMQAKDKDSLRHTFAALAAHWGEDAPLSVATKQAVLDWRAAMMKEPGKRAGTTLKPSTINHRLSMLSVLLELADLPAHGVKHLSVKGNERVRRVSDKELRQMKDWLVANAHLRGAVSMAQLITLGFETAARLSELLGLRWEDIGEGRCTFHKTKNGKSRTIPLTVPARRVLDSRTAFKARPFADLDEFRAVDLWALARKGIGLEGDEQFVFHLLRHERLTRLAERNVNALLLKQLAGHEQITTTQRYVHIAQTGLEEALGITPEVPAADLARLEEPVQP